MKVLIVGRGGREHALCWKVRQSPLVSEVFAAPGNAGMEDCAVRVPLAESEQEKLVEFAQREGIALTIIGPEAPLLEGLADRFREAGQMCIRDSLYPFQETIARQEASLEEAIENIDIGGPTLLRAAAKNHEHVTVLIDPADYPEVLAQLRERGEVSRETRRQLAAKAFRHTAAYDALIAEYLTGLTGEEFPERLTVTDVYKRQSQRRGNG